LYKCYCFRVHFLRLSTRTVIRYCNSNCQYDVRDDNDIILLLSCANNKLKRTIIDKTVIPCKSQTVASDHNRFPKAQESNGWRQVLIHYSLRLTVNTSAHCVRLWATLVVISATSRQVWSFRHRRQRRCKVKRLCLIKLRILMLYTRLMHCFRRVHLNLM